MKSLDKNQLIGFIVLFVILIFLLIASKVVEEKYSQTTISSYAECVEAGNAIMEIYPEQCVTQEGVMFVNPISQEQFREGNVSSSSTLPITEPTEGPKKVEPYPHPVPPKKADPDAIAPYPPAKSGCYVGGCSGQLCSEDPGMASTCEWREEYACYKNARCEKQSNGECGWTLTQEFQQCYVDSGPQKQTQTDRAQ